MKNTMNAIKELEDKASVNLSDLYDIIPVPIGDICDRIGIEVIFDKTMSSDYSGQIKFDNDNNKYVIKINDSKPVFHNIFTIAHELGHYLKHSELVKTKGYVDRKNIDYSSEELKQEREANNFAARLLMPKEKFIHHYKETQGNLSALQEVFRVSMEAIYYRALNLGLLLG